MVELTFFNNIYIFMRFTVKYYAYFQLIINNMRENIHLQMHRRASY
jgi:hypothetical protein